MVDNFVRCAHSVPHLDVSAESHTRYMITLGWKSYLIAAVFILSSATLLIGKVFCDWPIDAIAVSLFLIIWLPLIFPFLRRLKYKDLEIEFIEKTIKDVQEDLVRLANESEIEKEQVAPHPIKVAPTDVRLRHEFEQLNDKDYRVKVWLDAPDDFLDAVEQVRFERHPTFKNKYKTITNKPFKDIFKCWGEFTMRAQIRLKSGETLRRQRFLSLSSEDDSE